MKANDLVLCLLMAICMYFVIEYVPIIFLYGYTHEWAGKFLAFSIIFGVVFAIFKLEKDYQDKFNK